MNRLFENLPLTPLASKGTYFQLFNYENVSDLSDVDFAKYLTQEIGVATIPLSPFYTDQPNSRVVRFCFAKKAETMEKAAARLSTL